ncbi:histone deacetylase family protein [Roseitranquillus sediminis]|uniref:histone deacetylase family protein n=1 Tax=Roseitranquillus sediminis TaxID=2809051 RepID=UPI001D0C2D86|nr:histone deacetylase family protein [Roseitranquillus sediminis]MBM9594541.1 histone deacetylase family protein [Roseitranquillus sediminis]
MTLLFTHSDCLDHVTPPGHPERVERMRALQEALTDERFALLDRRDAPLGADADILRVHPQSYLDRIVQALPEEGWTQLDADTHLSPGSLGAARRGVGGNVAAVDAVLLGEVHNAFVGCRPPGHHAETETAMGFCLFGNVSIAAKRALDHHGLDRVAIVDFDVHHGNGTQDLMWDEERVLFVSTHQMPLYPGTGATHEIGAQGNILNLPLAPMTGSAEMRRTYEQAVFPALEEFEPQLLLISAGFDAHAQDPLANLNWSTDDFRWLTERLCGVAARHCQGRVVSTLEGGYDLQALAASVAAHVSVLMENT